jgi:sarcosine oxidase subunit gamma
MPEVTIEEREVGRLIQIAAWPTTLSAVEVTLADQPAALPIGPGRWLVLEPTPGLEASLADAAIVTDLSDARVLFRLEGQAVERLLRQGIKLDLDPRIFPPGHTAATMLGHVAVLLHRRSDASFDLYVGRSYAASAQAWLLDAQHSA